MNFLKHPALPTILILNVMLLLSLWNRVFYKSGKYHRVLYRMTLKGLCNGPSSSLRWFPALPGSWFVLQELVSNEVVTKMRLPSFCCLQRDWIKTVIVKIFLWNMANVLAHSSGSYTKKKSYWSDLRKHSLCFISC